MSDVGKFDIESARGTSHEKDCDCDACKIMKEIVQSKDFVIEIRKAELTYPAFLYSIDRPWFSVN